MFRRTLFCCLITGLLVAGCLTPVGPPVSVPATGSLAGVRPPLPRAGDIAVYVVRNAYNGEPRGDVYYKVERVDGDRTVVAVTASSPQAALAHTEVYAAYGNWLRHPLVNHHMSVDYDFAPPYPAYPFPLDPGKSWSQRVNATHPQTGNTRSVRIDGQVLGYERITVPAGAYDVVRIVRRVYAGDWDGFLQETNIVETEWYSPELGRMVRLESNSSWIDTSRSPGGGGFLGGGILRNNMVMRGDWNVYELTGYRIDGKSAGLATVAQ